MSTSAASGGIGQMYLSPARPLMAAFQITSFRRRDPSNEERWSLQFRRVRKTLGVP
jgi:hypothetical protein